MDIPSRSFIDLGQYSLHYYRKLSFFKLEPSLMNNIIIIGKFKGLMSFGTKYARSFE